MPRTQQQKQRAELSLTMIRARLPSLVKNYYDDSSSTTNRANLVGALRIMVRHENYKRELLDPSVNTPITRKVLGQLLNLDVAMQREVLMLDPSISDAGVRQAFHFWMTESEYVLDVNGEQVKLPLQSAQRARFNFENNEFMSYTAAGLKAIASALSEHCVLDRLALANLYFNDPGFKLIETKNGTDLGYRIEDASAFSALVAALPNAAITVLDLDNLVLTNNQMKVIATAVERNTHIERINFGDSPIDEAAARAIAHMLENNQSITAVTFGKTIITNPHFPMMVDSLQRNPNITEVNIGSTDIRAMGDLVIYRAGKSVPVQPTIVNMLDRNTPSAASAPASPAVPRKSTALPHRSESVPQDLSGQAADSGFASGAQTPAARTLSPRMPPPKKEGSAPLPKQSPPTAKPGTSG